MFFLLTVIVTGFAKIPAPSAQENSLEMVPIITETYAIEKAVTVLGLGSEGQESKH